MEFVSPKQQIIDTERIHQMNTVLYATKRFIERNGESVNPNITQVFKRFNNDQDCIQLGKLENMRFFFDETDRVLTSAGILREPLGVLNNNEGETILDENIEKGNYVLVLTSMNGFTKEGLTDRRVRLWRRRQGNVICFNYEGEKKLNTVEVFYMFIDPDPRLEIMVALDEEQERLMMFFQIPDEYL